MKQPINTVNAPSAIGSYSQAIQTGSTLYLSGQIGLVPETMEMVSDKIEPQIEQVLNNLSAVLHEAGGTVNNIVKLTVYLTDLKHFQLVNEGMERHFQKPFPARAAVEVKGLPKGAAVEIDAIAVLNQP